MFIIDNNISPPQLQTTTHDMTLPILQHEVTTITANKMISKEHQNLRERKTATTDGILYSVRGMFV